jgi:hypothetical protein
MTETHASVAECSLISDKVKTPASDHVGQLRASRAERIEINYLWLNTLHVEKRAARSMFNTLSIMRNKQSLLFCDIFF